MGVEIFVGQLLNTQFVKASNYKQLTVNQHNTIRKANGKKEGNKDPGRELKKGGN